MRNAVALTSLRGCAGWSELMLLHILKAQSCIFLPVLILLIGRIYHVIGYPIKKQLRLLIKIDPPSSLVRCWFLVRKYTWKTNIGKGKSRKKYLKGGIKPIWPVVSLENRASWKALVNCNLLAIFGTLYIQQNIRSRIKVLNKIWCFLNASFQQRFSPT